ncbi:MAG: hypothetical protein NTY02_19140 [Acidobacteria bacterium]|nr:hypothetical protein [Acidobacteriota bacterium]
MTPSPIRAFVPASARQIGGRVRAEYVSLTVRRTLQRLAARGRPVLAGPWLGEVGFELLYWIPFLRWAIDRFDLDRMRIVAVSRGGPASWYCDLADRYRDVFEFVEPGEFRRRNEERRAEVGEQKQVRPAAFDLAIKHAVDAAIGETCDWLHPALMYRVMQPYWWHHAPITWVHRHVRFARLGAATPPSGCGLPEHYVAVKFYYNDCLADTAANRASVQRVIDRLAGEGPVVSLSTGLALDEHGEMGHGEALSLNELARGMAPRDNLNLQSAVIAGADAFVGTYGGFSYLAPFLGIPATAVYADERGFNRAHLDLARSAFASLGGPDFRVMDAGGRLS